MTMTIDQVKDARGMPVVDVDGEQIGSLEEIFLDAETQQPEWIGIGTGFFGTKRVLVPVRGAEFERERVLVPYAKDEVKDAPDIDSDEISQETERELAAHYGLDYSERYSGTGLPEGSPADAPTGREAGEALTRSEEELRVGKRAVATGTVRLRKWVETEPVETEVELRQEKVRVERQPMNQPVDDAELGEAEVEVPVSREEPVVQKQAVAKERITLDKDVETERETVRDEVRKERVDVEGDDAK